MARLESQDNPRIIKALLSGKLLTFSSLATATDIPTTTLNRRLKILKDMGVVSFYQPAASYCLSQWISNEKLGFRTASEIRSDSEESFKPFRIFTIGYEGKTPDSFLRILQSNRVKRLVDVREIANSRKAGFSSGTLENFLRKHGIEYIHLKALGSPQSDRRRLRIDNDFASFSARFHRVLDNKKEDLNLLISLAVETPTAVMCFELDSSKCHRSIIVSRILDLGFDVKNI
jgi:DNA-binding Lrp family transcriptional regulator